MLNCADTFRNIIRTVGPTAKQVDTMVRATQTLPASIVQPLSRKAWHTACYFLLFGRKIPPAMEVQVNLSSNYTPC